MTVWDLIPALKRPGYSRRSLRDGENELCAANGWRQSQDAP